MDFLNIWYNVLQRFPGIYRLLELLFHLCENSATNALIL